MNADLINVDMSRGIGLIKSTLYLNLINKLL